MGRSRDIADMLSKTELANTGNEALITTFDTVDSAYVSANSTPALVFYSTLDSLPVSGLSVGQQAYVSANNRLYISDGSGWYNKALITLSPTMTLDPTGTITLATDGVTTFTVTIVANDSDTPGSGLTYSVESDGNMLGRAVISQDSSVFTIRPLSSDSGATTGTFTLTFRTSDGVNLATDSADFSLTFVTAVDSSAETVLLIKAAGNSATNANITYQNSSDVSTGFTETGDPQASTFSPYRSGGYSTYFDGTGDAIEVPQTGFPAIGTSDFTIEAWVYANSLASNMAIFDGRPSGTSGGNYITLQWHASTYGMGFYSAGWRITSPTNTLTANTWHHIALSRSGNSTKLFVDGTQVGSTYSDTTSYLYGRNYIGGLYNNTNTWWNGYMRDFRVSIGTARYTSNFTPSTEALTADVNTDVLVCHLPYFKDGSTNDATLTISGNTKTVPFGPYDYSPWTADDVGGSVYFDGSDDGLSTTTTAVGTGEFNYEAWIYLHTTSAETIVDTRPDGTSTGIEFRVHNGVLRLIVAGTTVCTGTTTLLTNVWYHVAARRNSSGVCRVYLNGKRDGSFATKTDNLTNTSIDIGQQYAGSQYFHGYIADLRFRTESEYSTSYTPPTSPFSNTASTQLLMNNKSDANIYDAAAGNVLVSIDDIYGNGVRSNTTPRKFTTSSSMFFSSDGSYLLVPSTESLGFGTGDFTWEFWIWSNGMIASYILEFGTGGDNGIHYPTSQGHLSYYNSTVGTGSTLYTTGFSTFDSSTWMHIAASRVNGTTYLFKDGTLTASASDSHNYGTSNALYIGTYGATPGSYNFYGRMQDIRITKGRGRYTSSFTPPTAEFDL